MSFQGISVNLPDPFSIYPQPVAFPLTKTFHVPATQFFSASATLKGSNLTAPIIGDSTGGAVVLTLPSTVSVFSALGGLVDANGNVAPNSPIQLNDLFVIPVVNVGTANTITTSATGVQTIAASVSGALVIQWTAVTVGAAPTYSAYLA